MEGDSEIDLFIRHLQAELEETSEILDLQAKEHRQWQIEVAIQEGLKYLKKLEERKILGLETMFREKDAVRVLRKKQEANQNNSMHNIDDAKQKCPKCEADFTEDLGFCESCGYKK
ncbi:MAG: Uncharacterised protein [Methanobacteriota archaeon]|nr:MAG: Uncharacterised protein [Euryarchaeota archaeon]